MAYLDEWTKHYEEFKVFTWMNLQKVPEFDHIQICIDYLRSKNVVVSEDKCFDQLSKLKQFIDDEKNNEKFQKKLSHEKWVDFFQNCRSPEQYSEFLIIAEYFFAIPAHNANVERIFSLIGIQWTDERNRLILESIRQLMIVKYNFKELDCLDFFKMIKDKKDVLLKVKSKEKYLYEHRDKDVHEDEDEL